MLTYLPRSAMKSLPVRFVVGSGPKKADFYVPSKLFPWISDPLDKMINDLGAVGAEQRVIELPDDEPDLFVALVEFAYRNHLKETFCDLLAEDLEAEPARTLTTIAETDLAMALAIDAKETLLRQKFLALKDDHVYESVVVDEWEFTENTYARKEALSFLIRLYLFGVKYWSLMLQHYVAENIWAVLCHYPYWQQDDEWFLDLIESVWSVLDLDKRGGYLGLVLVPYVAWQGNRLFKCARFRRIMITNENMLEGIIQAIHQ